MNKSNLQDSESSLVNTPQFISVKTPEYSTFSDFLRNLKWSIKNQINPSKTSKNTLQKQSERQLTYAAAYFKEHFPFFLKLSLGKKQHV